MSLDDIAKEAEKDLKKPGKYKPTAGFVGTVTNSAAPRVAASVGQMPPVAVSNSGRRKSGYARDLHPDLLDAAEKVGLSAPPAAESGGQEGRVIPAEIKPTAHYEPVDVDEAMRRADQRRNGRLAPIAGGLNDPAVVSTASKPADQYEDTAMEVGDSPAAVVGEPVTKHTQEHLIDAAHVGVIPPERQDIRKILTQLAAAPVLSRTDLYFKQRTRVSFIMPNGTYAVPAVDVRVTESGVIILLPYSDNDATFIPNAGSRFTIMHAGKQTPCYFPGTVFTLEPLGVTVLALLLDSDK